MFVVYSRIAIYRATNLSRKADFLREHKFAYERVLASCTAPSIEQNRNQNSFASGQ